MTTMTITHAGRLYAGMTAAQLSAAGVPAQVIADAHSAERAATAKAECRQRIYAVASSETQMNMASAAAVISAKTASSRTDEEKAILTGLEAAMGWVGAMRANVVTLVANGAAEITDDANWPDVPAEVMDLVEQF